MEKSEAYKLAIKALEAEIRYARKEEQLIEDLSSPFLPELIEEIRNKRDAIAILKKEVETTTIPSAEDFEAWQAEQKAKRVKEQPHDHHNSNP